MLRHSLKYDITCPFKTKGRQDSSVGVANGYGLDGPGIEPGEARCFAHVQTGHGAHPAACTVGTGSFPVVKLSMVIMTTYPVVAPRSRKVRAIPLSTIWACSHKSLVKTHELIRRNGYVYQHYFI
jgi:hypothetical protein